MALSEVWRDLDFMGQDDKKIDQKGRVCALFLPQI